MATSSQGLLKLEPFWNTAQIESKPTRESTSLINSHEHTQRRSSRTQSDRRLLEPFPEVYLVNLGGLQRMLGLGSTLSEDLLSNNETPTFSRQLFALGTVLNPLKSQKWTAGWNCIAVPGGLLGQVLQLLPMHSVPRTWPGEKSAELATLQTDQAGIGIWNGDGTEIRQLCFGYFTEYKAYLAVRTVKSIYIFRPRFIKKKESGGTSLRPRYWLKLGDPDDQETPLSDVAFSPFTDSQVTTIDIKGHWKIWELPDKKGKPAVVIHDGAINVRRYDSSNPCQNRLRIAWILDQSTLLVSCSSSLHLLDAHARPLHTRWPSLGDFDEFKIILDFTTRASLGHSDVFITTDSRIIWLRARTQLGEQEQSPRHVSWEVLFSRRHHRDSRDTTLQSHMSDQPNGPSLFLYSQRTDLVTWHALWNRDVACLAPLHSFSSLLVSPRQHFPKGNDPEDGILQLAVVPCTVTEKSAGLFTKTQFHVVLKLYKDLILRSALYYGAPSAQLYEPHPGISAPAIEPPIWKSKTKTGPRSRAIVSLDQFVVKDGEESDSGVDEASSKVFNERKSSHSARPAMKQYTVSNRALYEAVSGASLKEQSEKRAQWRDLLRQVALLADEDKSGPMHLLSSLLKDFPLVHDIDDASELTSDVALLPCSDSLDMEQFGLSLNRCDNLYRHIIQTWTSRLPAHMPVHFRWTREKLARQVSCAVYFSRLAAGGASSRKNERWTSWREGNAGGSEGTNEVANALQRLGKVAAIQAPNATENKLVNSLLHHWGPLSTPAEHEECDAICRRPTFLVEPEDAASDSTRRHANLSIRMGSRSKKTSASADEDDDSRKSKERFRSSTQPQHLYEEEESQSQPATIASQKLPGKYGGRAKLPKKFARKSGF